MSRSDSSDLQTHILFCPSFFYRLDEKQWKDQKPYPPYGTLYAAALMKQAGYPVTLFDTHLRSSPAEILPILHGVKPKYLVIYDDGFNYLTKMCLTDMRKAALEIIKYSKQTDCTIIVCNSDATDHSDIYLDGGADYIILGEGELTLKHLIKALEEGETNLSQLTGITFRQTGKTTITPGRPVLKDLDSLPDPAWELVDIDAYRRIWIASQGYFSLNIATTRGCPYKCNWCAKPIYGNRYNSRSPQRIVSEMKYLVERYGAEHFWMADDIFGLNPHWVEEFRNEVNLQQLNIPYKIQSRADLLIRENYIQSLVESGLHEVWIGAESGSQKILDAMDKGITVNQIMESTRLLQSKKIKVGFFLQFGYPGEGMSEINETMDMLLRLMPDDLGISISYPLPGTVFYEKVKAQLLEKRNWINSDDLDMMYAAPFSPRFYKQLHHLVHKLFRLKQGWQNLISILKFQGTLDWVTIRSILALVYYLPASLTNQYQLRRLASS